MSVAMTMPELSADELAHSQRLLRAIGAQIEQAGGWISFERFMDMALYEPALGYYSAGATKLGGAGDFVTAPEVSSLFSRCLAAQCEQVLRAVGEQADILELGAGAGTMAVDVLTELAARDCLPRRYCILEVSADLRERQQRRVNERLPALAGRVQWLDQLPTAFQGVILANEVLDALPVQRFRIREGAVKQLGVAWADDRLSWSEVNADPALESAVRAIETQVGALPEGYTSEVNLRLAPWIAGIAGCLQQGAVIFIDYGLPRHEYYTSARSAGTLLCHFRHRYHNDPLIHLGVQDIGAWVDFTAVAEAGVDAGLVVAGYTTQAHFLIGNGLGELLAAQNASAVADRAQLAQQAMVLTLPGEMGERFKVIGFTRDIQPALQGFSVRDFAAAL